MAPWLFCANLEFFVGAEALPVRAPQAEQTGTGVYLTHDDLPHDHLQRLTAYMEEQGRPGKPASDLPLGESRLVQHRPPSLQLAVEGSIQQALLE